MSSASPATSIPTPAKCEIRAVIRYLVWKGKPPVEIFNEVKSAYGDCAMNRTSVYKWCREFKGGRTSVHDDQRSGRPSIVTDELVEKIENAVRDDRRLTVDELSDMFPQISRSLLHETVTETLGYRKLSARWVPKQLTDDHKVKRVETAQEFLRRYEEEGEDFLKSIVTGDETWVAHYTPETKRQSQQWCHTSSPSAKKFKTTISAKKIMASVFWDSQGVLLVEYLPQGETINAARYCETLKKLRRAIQNKRRGRLTKGVCLLHDNARPHTANVTKQLLDTFGWDVLDHPSHSPDLAPSDYHLFPSLKQHLGGKKFSTDEEVKEEVDTWMTELAGNYFADGIKKLIPRLKTCIQRNGDYVEK